MTRGAGHRIATTAGGGENEVEAKHPNEDADLDYVRAE